MKHLLFIGSIILLSEASYPPEVDMTVPEIIAYYQYPVEIISVTTKDDYILQLHRIPFGIHDVDKSKTGKPVVFLQHGLLSCSADWVVNLPNQSAGFIFADAGFDVWMGNVRGNSYSTGHRKYSRADAAYWQFTWDEMSKYDLEAMIDTVLNITKQKSLYYVGHSQGTMIMFAKLASDQYFKSKIRKFFALAPVGTVSHIKGLISYMAKYFNELPMLVKFLGNGEFLPNTWLTKLFGKFFCGLVFTNPLCDDIIFQIAGPESNQFNQSRLIVYITHTPAGTSAVNVLHWTQLVNSGKIQAFDYGSDQLNQKHYGHPTPPLYNLSRVNADTYLYWGDKDWLADPIDVKESLLSTIPSVYLKESKELFDFNHFDFILGIRAVDEVYQPIIKIIKNDTISINL